MVHAQNAHIGPAPGAALLDLLCGRVEDAQKGNRAGSNPAGGAHPAVARAQAREGKARAAAGFVNHGRVFDGIKDLFDGVAHGQHEAGRKLAQVRTCIHERGGVGQEFPAGHQLIEFPRQGFGAVGALVGSLLRGNSRGHAPEEVARRFFKAPVGVFALITLLQYHGGIAGEFRFRQIGRQRQHDHPSCRCARAGGWVDYRYRVVSGA